MQSHGIDLLRSRATLRSQNLCLLSIYQSTAAMEMSAMSMSGGMGIMSTGNGVPSLFYLQKMFWAAVGSAVALATLVNLYNKLLCLQRYRLLFLYQR